MILLAIGVSAVVTLGLLLSRGMPAATVSAAPAKSAAPKAKPATGSASTTSSDPTSKWSSERRTDWIGSYKKSVAFEVPAENTVALWMTPFRPVLVVRCIKAKTEAFVLTGSALKIEPQTEDHTVSVTLDSATMRTERWPDSTEHAALFAPNGAEFAQQLTHAELLRFGYTPHNAAPVTAMFKVAGLGPLLEPAAKECGWKK